MKLLGALKREHEMIEAVASALVGWATARAQGAADPADAQRFVRFFETYVGNFHHAREECVLFPALERETDVPTDRGPIAALLADHAELRAATDEWSTLEGTKRWASKLLHHIDAENTVLFPECEARFRRASVLELDDREPDDAEHAARDEGAALVERYGKKPFVDPTRGDGCVCCPAFGVRCDGVEREWSSDDEWHDMIDRVG